VGRYGPLDYRCHKVRVFLSLKLTGGPTPPMQGPYSRPPSVVSPALNPKINSASKLEVASIGE
jgi:hypothetical protein